MRIRHLLLGSFVSIAAVVGPASLAHAQDDHEPAAESEGGGHAEEGADLSHIDHCVIEEVEKGTTGDPESCVEAPSPILPETNEILWGSISFLIVFAAMAKFAYPALKKGMEGRTERIRADLERAETAKDESEQVLVDYRAQLADAKAESARIIEEARQAADALKKDLAVRAEADIAEMRRRAAADIESSKAQAVADLRSEVAALALGAAEMVVQKSLDRTTQIELIESYINQVGSRN